MRFYPSNLQVHQGNAGGIGRPWSMFEPDPDEGAEALKANLAAVFPNRDCGWPTEAPCDFDGRRTESGDVLHSGLALLPEGDSAQVHQLDFSVTVNGDPGETFDVVDLVNPRMSMQIEVVDADAELATAAEIESRGRAPGPLWSYCSR